MTTKDRIELGPGETASAEWRERKNRRKRGTKAKARFAAAEADFAAFLAEGIALEPGGRTRAGKVHRAYIEWKIARGDGEPMGIRAFGLRARKVFKAVRGSGKTITYEGCSLR